MTAAGRRLVHTSHFPAEGDAREPTKKEKYKEQIEKGQCEDNLRLLSFPRRSGLLSMLEKCGAHTRISQIHSHTSTKQTTHH